MSNLATIAPRASLVTKFASKYSIEPDKLLPILKATAFKVKDGEATNEQMAALLVVADQYGLNPFTKEIFAFPDKQNGIVPVVGVDGWSRIVNDHPQSNGFEFRAAPDFVTLPDAQPCPEWMEVVIYRKDRDHPIVVREYLDEVYRPLGIYKDGNKMKPGPWQSHTKRFLRHKTLIQGARIAYGFGGIFDEDEAERIIERDMGTADVTSTVVAMPQSKSQKPAERVIESAAPPQTESVVLPSDAGATGSIQEEMAVSDEAPIKAEKEGLLTRGQIRILRARMEAAALSDVDIQAKFGAKLDDIGANTFEAVSKFIRNPMGE